MELKLNDYIIVALFMKIKNYIVGSILSSSEIKINILKFNRSSPVNSFLKTNIRTIVKGFLQMAIVLRVCHSMPMSGVTK